MTKDNRIWTGPFHALPILGVVILLAALGCGPKNALNRQAISGTVTLDGQPVAMGTIRFSPEQQAGVSSGGPIHEGKFAIQATEGLPPGKYLVRIYSTQQDNSPVAGEPPGLASQKPAIDLIPPQYNSATVLTAEVADQKENVFPFDLKSGKK